MASSGTGYIFRPGTGHLDATHVPPGLYIEGDGGKLSRVGVPGPPR
jgi:hypothetical protein